MMFTIKKRISLLIACALVLVNLYACDRKEKTPDDISKPPTASPEVLPTDIFEPPETSPVATPEPLPDDLWSPLPADYEDAKAEVLKLVSSDMWAVDFLINLTMDAIPIYDDVNPEPQSYPVTVPEYAEMNNLLTKLDNIYLSSEVYSPFFLYPIFGNPQVFGQNGMTYVYPHYLSNFDSRINENTVKVTKLTKNRAVFSFDIIKHDYFQNGSMSMTLTQDGWRIDESFFFYCLKRLNLLNTDSSTAWEDNPLLDFDQNAGSAKRFIGECMFYNIFINDLGSSWDNESLAGFYETQNEAFRYLEEQAALFGYELYCSATDAENALYLDVSINVPGNKDNASWFDFFLRDTEYGDVNGLLETLKLYADGIYFDNYGLIININKQGRSYSIPYYANEQTVGNYSAERIVLYFLADSDNKNIPLNSTLVHEILRIFGALDLNYPQDGEDTRKEIIMRYFPFEIMHSISYNVREASVSAFTAFRVGWRNTLPDQLLMFQAKE